MLALTLILGLFGICAGQHTFRLNDFYEWLDEASPGVLSSDALRALVPLPEFRVENYAQERFNIMSAIIRLRDGTESYNEQRLPRVDSSELENVTDEYKLGLIKFWSIAGIQRDFSAALQHFENSARDGNAEAMFMAGFMHATGVLGAIEQNVPKGLGYYTAGAIAGSVEAQCALGHRQLLGIDVPRNENFAEAAYALAASSVLEMLEEESLYFHRESGNYWAFGAETNTGLYGPRVYRRVTSHSHSLISKGPVSDAALFIKATFRDEFDGVEDAMNTLYYRAVEEKDTAAMFALARLYALEIGENKPNYRLSLRFTRMCLQNEPDLSPQSPEMPRVLHAFCTEFLAEKYLFGAQGVKADLNRARELFNLADDILDQLPAQYPRCSSCWSGLVLADLFENPDKLTINQELVYAHISELPVFDDYTAAMLAAYVDIERGLPQAAVEVLRKVVVDTNRRAPGAALLLAQIDKPEKRLSRAVEGLQLSAASWSPIRFAHTAYIAGDLESAMLAFAISAELGIPSAALNLADLLDVRHSALGHTLSKRWPVLSALSQWPVPSFVRNREYQAFTYYMRASLHNSVDALAKAVEYGNEYGFLSPQEVQNYLLSLADYNFGMAYWMLSKLAYNAKDFVTALKWSQLAVVCPDVWVPVKVVQLQCLWQLFSAAVAFNKVKSFIAPYSDVIIAVGLGVLALLVHFLRR